MSQINPLTPDESNRICESNCELHFVSRAATVLRSEARLAPDLEGDREMPHEGRFVFQQRV